MVSPYLLPEVAELKAERSVNNARMRSAKKAPLFANQIEVEKADVTSMIARVAADRREKLERDHEQARRSTELRAQVESIINSDQFAVLKAERSRFPRAAVYGLYFWEKQLRQIKETGKPDIHVPRATATDRLNIEWLRPDHQVTWLSPAGPRQARVLYVGVSTVLVKLIGEPITDYDPREFPYANAWAKTQDLRRSGC